jgi:UDP:flavonoid glycosyltransferase YjiC (YdhE family)
MVQKIINNWRRSRLSLEPLEKLPFKKLSNQDLPFFYGFSKYVLPRAPEWRDNIHVTGYWFPDTSDRLKIPREVISFIEDGEKPVYFGFGSIPDSEAGVVLKEVIGAIKSTEERWVILKGWFEKSSVKLPDNVLLIGNIPHEWLFPQCKIVIHHGGAGTTASAIRAGVPQIVIPFYVDQIFWAWRVEKLGLGLKVPRGKLSSKTLISAINKIKSDRSFYKKSQELSSLVSSEKGVDTALRILKERYLLYH